MYNLPFVKFFRSKRSPKKLVAVQCNCGHLSFTPGSDPSEIYFLISKSCIRSDAISSVVAKFEIAKKYSDLFFAIWIPSGKVYQKLSGKNCQKFGKKNHLKMTIFCHLKKWLMETSFFINIF